MAGASRRPWFATLFVAGAALCVLMVAASACGGDDGGSQPVATAVPTSAPASGREAKLADASKSAGFELRVPWLPDGFEVELVSSGSVVGPFRSAVVAIAGPRGRIDLTQADAPIEFLGAKASVPSRIAGATVWRIETLRGTSYILNTASRGFQLSMPKDSLPPEDQVLRILESMAQ